MVDKMAINLRPQCHRGTSFHGRSYQPTPLGGLSTCWINYYTVLYHRICSQKQKPGMGTEKKKKPEVKILGNYWGGGGVSPPEAEENTIFSILKMQFQDLLAHRLLGLSTNATPKLLAKGNQSCFFKTYEKIINFSLS